jgi:hypothetical protein
MICAIIIKRSPVKGKNIEHLEKKEKYIFSMPRVINRFVIHPLEAVGWEGNYLTVVSSTQTKVICLYKAYITVTSFHYFSLIFIYRALIH